MRFTWKTVLFLLVLILAAYQAGHKDGVKHAIEDSEIWTVDVYTPGHPELSEWNGYDQLIYIDLDGETYMHGMYQG